MPVVSLSHASKSYRVNRPLDYSEDDVSLATGPQGQAIKPNYKAIKPS